MGDSSEHGAYLGFRSTFHSETQVKGIAQILFVICSEVDTDGDSGPWANSLDKFDIRQVQARPEVGAELNTYPAAAT